jgi:hypothetical protein
MSIDRLGAPFRRNGRAARWTPDDYTDGGSGTVIYDAPGEDLLAGAVNATLHEVLYRATEFVGMDEGDTLEIELDAAGAPGTYTAYTVRTIRPVDDGALMRARLMKI